MTTDDSPTPAAASSGRSHHRIALAVLVAVLLIAAGAFVAYPHKPPLHAIDVTGVDWGRDFRLRDADGRPRTLADYRGDVVLLFFGFTQCPDVCPTALSRSAEVAKRLGPDAERLRVVFVTLDPERDTPAVLGEYVRAFDPRFVALRGDAKETDDIARDFRVFYRKVPTGSSYTLDHTAVTYAFDRRGRLRLAIGPTESTDDLASDVRRLLDDGPA